MNILAVDDELHALHLLEDAIKKSVIDSTVYLCQDEDLALAVAREHGVDVAFLDIHMPGMGGIALALALKEINPKINIIFATGYSEYMREGIDMRMSGYLLKPVTPEAVRTEMENLRNPVQPKSNKLLRIITFGNFEIFAAGAPVKFERKQAKEILAYLVDKRGTSVSYPELAAALFEDDVYERTQQKNLQVYIASMLKTLHAVGADEVISRNRQGILLKPDMVDCDLYEFLRGNVAVINSYTGQYMNAYSWAEFTAGYLDRVLMK